MFWEVSLLEMLWLFVVWPLSLPPLFYLGNNLLLELSPRGSWDISWTPTFGSQHRFQISKAWAFNEEGPRAWRARPGGYQRQGEFCFFSLPCIVGSETSEISASGAMACAYAAVVSQPESLGDIWVCG